MKNNKKESLTRELENVEMDICEVTIENVNPNFTGVKDTFESYIENLNIYPENLIDKQICRLEESKKHSKKFILLLSPLIVGNSIFLINNAIDLINFENLDHKSYTIIAACLNALAIGLCTYSSISHYKYIKYSDSEIKILKRRKELK